MPLQRVFQLVVAAVDLDAVVAADRKVAVRTSEAAVHCHQALHADQLLLPVEKNNVFISFLIVLGANEIYVRSD